MAIIVTLIVGSSVAIGAQWPKHPVAGAPRDAEGNILMDGPAPRTADGKPDLSGVWMRAESGPPRAGGPGRGRAAGNGTNNAPANAGNAAATTATGSAPAAGANSNAAFSGGRGGVIVDVPTERFPYDPSGPPVATFFEAGGNMAGGLPYTPWASEVKKQRMALVQKDNPDANCLPMGFLQFHLQPQPRKIVQTPQMILIEYEANYGIRHIYTDGRTLPPQGDVQPWWYGYSVGRWDGNDLVVDTNNLRGAEESVHDGWLDVNGSPYSNQARITERFRRPAYGHLQIDMTVDDPKSYTKPWTVRVDQRILPDQELIEFVCNENQQFRRRIKID
jgi:hypothetical protein